MNEQHCNEGAAWTCRQPALVQAQSMTSALAQINSGLVPAGAVHDGTLVHSFVPGVVAHYLTHQDFPLTRELAVVFVDLAHSTRVLSHQPPTHALSLIQRFTELVTEIAVAHCGDVKDYEGDGALLYFASIADATRAALAMRTAFTTLHTQEGQAVQARFSLNVGEVTIGVIGSALRRSVALIGPAVNLAARLLKHAAPGGIIAPQTVVERLQQDAPPLARDFRRYGTCLTVRDFEDQCVMAYSLPPSGLEPRVQSQNRGVSCQRSGVGCQQSGVSSEKMETQNPAAADSFLLPSGSLFSSPQLPISNSRPLAPNVFHREGDYWTLSFAGITCRLKASRGMHYLAHLLQHPHQEFHAITLANEQATLDDATGNTNRVQTTGIFGDTGDALDAQACAAYKQRIAELREDLAEAQRFNDLGRLEKLQGELHFLMQALARDVGLGGRMRKTVSVAERARISVTKSIKITLRKISEYHPELGHHLPTTIKTGTYCSYAPDTRLPIRWQN